VGSLLKTVMLTGWGGLGFYVYVQYTRGTADSVYRAVLKQYKSLNDILLIQALPR